MAKVRAVEDGGKICIISGTRCSERWCCENGCVFPSCAVFSGEEFSTVEEAKLKHTNLELV